MSMREYPGHGYIVPIKMLKPILIEGVEEEFDAILDEGNAEEIGQFLTDNLAQPYPTFELYCPSEEDTVDDEVMQQGEWYAVFDESDLFVKTPTPEHAAMMKLGIVPKLSSWSVWG